MIPVGTLKEETRSMKPADVVASGFIPGIPDGARISSSLFSVKVETAEGLIDMAAETVLLLERGADGELNSQEVEQQMAILSAYRFAFVRARVILGKDLKRNQRHLKQWLGLHRKSAFKTIIEWRAMIRNVENVSASWFGSVTKDMIEEELMKNPEYEQKLIEIEDLEADIETLKGLEECVTSHGFMLKGISDKLMQEKLRAGLDR